MEAIDDYAMGRSEAETRRLTFQHQVYGPLTRRFFQAAGIGAGMKVLDIGSGAGDVALLAADLVGPQGRVVGVDMNAEILETARKRVEAVGWRNVTFRSGDVRALDLDDDFDVVVGRFVLMYVPEPATLVRHLTTRLVPGGLVAFHEIDFHFPPTTIPPSSLSERFQRWAIPPPGSPGPDMRMGSNLFRTYLEAGLPGPQLIVEAAAGGGEHWPGYELLSATLRSLMPVLEKTVGLDPAEVDIDTLADRMRADTVSRHAVHVMPHMFGAWSRKPGNQLIGGETGR